jgi:hypothetical protein
LLLRSSRPLHSSCRTWHLKLRNRNVSVRRKFLQHLSVVVLLCWRDRIEGWDAKLRSLHRREYTHKERYNNQIWLS